MEGVEVVLQNFIQPDSHIFTTKLVKEDFISASFGKFVMHRLCFYPFKFFVTD